MGFKLGNVDNKASLIFENEYYDLSEVSNGKLTNNMNDILHSIDVVEELYSDIDKFEPTGSLDDVKLGPPITNSNNCFAVGLNYRNHAEESAMEIPPFPMVFTKHTTCICGPYDDIEMRSDIVDYEAELVAVIGVDGKNISADDAWNHVAGLTVGQDISDRSVQFHASPPQFNLGKSFDTFGPIGPYISSVDSLDDKESLALKCWVNDELRQETLTDDLIFDIPTLISYISEFITLNTGDLIFTGTPAGVGATQGKFLKDGDLLKTTIDGLGTLENTCIKVQNHSNTEFLPEFLKARIPKEDE